MTLDSNVGSSEFVGLLVVTRLDRVLEVFLEGESYCGIPLVACLLSFSVLVIRSLWLKPLAQGCHSGSSTVVLG